MDELIGTVAEMKAHVETISNARKTKTDLLTYKVMEQHMDRLMVRLVRLGTAPFYHERYTPEAIARVVEQGVKVFMQHRGLF